jgi:hypothetical protein
MPSAPKEMGSAAAAERKKAREDKRKEKERKEAEWNDTADPRLENIVLLLHILMAVLGFIIILVAAAFAYYWKMAFVLSGAMMLICGILGAVGVYTKNWILLFAANCGSVCTFLMVFVYGVIGGMIAFDIRDPVSQSVDETWVEVRPEFEKQDFCRPPTADVTKVGECELFYTWAKAAVIADDTIRGGALRKLGDAATENACPHTISAMAANCTMSAECEAPGAIGPAGWGERSGEVGGKHSYDCFKCDDQCRKMLIDDLRGGVGYVVTFFFVVFFCLCGVLLYNVQLLAVARDIDHWNEYMEMEANKRKERLENEKDPLEEAFEKIDLDGSGTLDREEVRQVLEMISGGGGEPVSEMELNEAMAELDGDSSGEVRLKAHVAK